MNVPSLKFSPDLFECKHRVLQKAVDWQRVTEVQSVSSFVLATASLEALIFDI